MNDQALEELRESLKRCPPGTIEAALDFRQNANLAAVPVVVMGIIERYLEPEQRPKLRSGDDSLRLIDDLGVDSLTMMEIIMLVEESLGVSFDNQELRELRTVGDVKSFMTRKLRGEEADDPAAGARLPFEEILMVMPQQPPFLFLQDARLSPAKATGTYKVDGGEFFLRGHFKDNPVMPASVLLEALGQLAVLFLLKSGHSDFAPGVRPDSIFFTSCDGIRCHRVCRPGDVLQLEIQPKRIRHPLAVFQGSITVKGEKAAFAEELTLTFDFQAAPGLAGNTPRPAQEPAFPVYRNGHPPVEAANLPAARS